MKFREYLQRARKYLGGRQALPSKKFYPLAFEQLEDRLVPSVSAEEQLFVWLLNRARNQPQYYAEQQLDRAMQNELAGVERRGALAVNDSLFSSSEAKALNMALNQPLAPPLGVAEALQKTTSNDVYGLLRDFIVDAGHSDKAYRRLLLGMDKGKDGREVGVGHYFSQSTNYWAVHSGSHNPSDRFITGVVYSDVNGDKQYNLNEGIGDVYVQVGSTLVKTNAFGGYSIPVPQGTYTVTAKGPFMGTGSSKEGVKVGFPNVEVDFIAGNAEGIENFYFDRLVPVTVNIKSFVQIDNPDEGRLNGGQGDYYARVYINGVKHESEIIDGNGSWLLDGPFKISPNHWTWTEWVDKDQGTVKVTIRILDSDTEDPWGAVFDFDDEMDINPDAGNTEVRLQVKLATLAVTPLAPLTSLGGREYLSEGNGDKNRGKITFEITGTPPDRSGRALHEASGAIEVYKWHDQNADGIHQETEPYLEGWTMYLDLNENGIMDPDEPSASTSNSAGALISNLRPGVSYTVAEVMQPGWYQTYPGDPLGTHNMLVEPDKTTTVSFGNAQLGHISGYKWEDLNYDGVWQETERPLYGWTIYLDLNQNGKWDSDEPSTMTRDGDGSYNFDVKPGEYVVGEIMQTDWLQTFPGAAGTHTVQVLPGQSVTGVNFGNALGAQIHGSVWHDANGDSVWDTRGEPGLERWTVYLDADDNGVLNRGELFTTTKADGSFKFTGLKAGTYVVREQLPTGWVQSFPRPPAHVVTVGNGQVSSRNHFGNYQPAVDSNGQLTVRGDAAGPTDDAIVLRRSELDRTAIEVLVNGSVYYSGPFDQLRQVIIEVGEGNDTIILESVPPGIAVVVNGWNGSDTLIGPSQGLYANTGWNLWDLTGVNQGVLNGNVTFTSVENLKDGAAPDLYQFHAGASLSGNITGGGTSDTLTYSPWLNPYPLSVDVNLATGSATGVAGKVANIPNIIGSPQNDTFVVNDANSNFYGGDGQDHLIVQDWGRTAGRSYVLGKDLIRTDGVDHHFYSMEFLTLVTDSNDNTLTVLDTPDLTQVEFAAYGQGDTLVGPNRGLYASTGWNVWNLSGRNEGSLNYLIYFFGIENLKDGLAPDVYVFRDRASLSGTITGGGNADTLDFWPYQTGVYVNLATGRATTMAGDPLVGAIVNIPHVSGTFNDDIIIGSDAANILVGYGGNDVLIGGKGLDYLYGGDGDDLLIGSSIADLPDETLRAIAAAWASSKQKDDRLMVIDDTLTDALDGGLGSNLVLQ